MRSTYSDHIKRPKIANMLSEAEIKILKSHVVVIMTSLHRKNLKTESPNHLILLISLIKFILKSSKNLFNI